MSLPDQQKQYMSKPTDSLSQSDENTNRSSIKNHGAYNLMDDNNKRAADIMEKDGVDAAVVHMMTSANMDYSRMRTMYG
jgi:hypothetical protein